MTPDVATIARGLTEPQRKLLMRGMLAIEGDNWFVPFDAHRATAYALCRHRLVDDFFVITPLGKQVRAHLLENKP